jgi:hypothetical protein
VRNEWNNIAVTFDGADHSGDIVENIRIILMDF